MIKMIQCTLHFGNPTQLNQKATYEMRQIQTGF